MGSGLKHLPVILLLLTAGYATAGDLDFQAPEKLVLGKDRSAEITLKKPAGEMPALLVNTGSLSPLEETPDGRLKAVYTPPKKKFPQVAVIAAVGPDGSLLDWIVVPLYGKARVSTKTERGAKVILKIADEEYGPRKANRRGRAKFSVIVPPGVLQGTTIATDRLGNRKEAPLELKAPPFNRLLAICPKSGDRLVVLAVDPQGDRDEAAQLDLEATNGRLAKDECVAAGIYRSLFTVAPEASVGDQAVLSAALVDEKASVSSCSAEIQGGPLTRLKLSVDPPAFTAGSGELAVTIELQDSKGNPSQPVPVDLAVDFGELSETETESLGKRTASLALPDALKGKSQVKITARSQTDPVVSAEAIVDLKPASPSSLELEVEKDASLADGSSTTAVTAQVSDRFGNPIPDLKLAAQARGKIGRFQKYQAAYTAPEDVGEGFDEIRVRIEGEDVESSVHIKLQEVRHALSVCPRIGYSTNLGKISSPFFAADAAVRLPFYPDVTVGLEMGYYWSDVSRTSAGGEEQVDTSVWVFPILARGAYHFPIRPVDLYLGLGVGTAIVGREISSESAGRNQSGQAHFAVSGTAGADVALGPGRVAAEVGYLHAVGENGTIKGSVGGLLLTAGYRFEF